MSVIGDGDHGYQPAGSDMHSFEYDIHFIRDHKDNTAEYGMKLKEMFSPFFSRSIGRQRRKGDPFLSLLGRQSTKGEGADRSTPRR